MKQGFALFRKQPAELSTLFISYMFLMLALNLIPLVGQIMPLILIPVFSLTFLQACFQVERGQRVYPNLLLTGFRSPALPSLLILGSLYLVAALVAVGASSLVDGGVFWKVMSGGAELESPEVQGSNMTLAMLFAAVVYAPAAMAFWYAAPLIAWHKMGLAKALFYSFFTVFNSFKAFMLYMVAWIFLGVFLPAIVSTVLALVVGKVAALFVLMPLSVILTVIMYCSFYPTYTEFYSRPDTAAPVSAE